MKQTKKIKTPKIALVFFCCHICFIAFGVNCFRLGNFLNVKRWCVWTTPHNRSTRQPPAKRKWRLAFPQQTLNWHVNESWFFEFLHEPTEAFNRRHTLKHSGTQWNSSEQNCMLCIRNKSAVLFLFVFFRLCVIISFKMRRQ